MKYMVFIAIIFQIQLVMAQVTLKKLSGSPDSNTILTTMSCPGNGFFVVGGMDLHMTGQYPKMPPYILTGDSESVKLATGNLALYSKQFGDMLPVNALDFLDQDRGWVAVTKGMSGAGMYKTKNGGGIWTPLKMSGRVSALKFFDEKRAVAVGEAGYAAWTDDSDTKWNTVDTGTKADLKCMFWVDDKRGFAAGYSTSKDDNMQDHVDQGVVLGTTDGGRSWHTLYTTNGLALCPLFFLPDAKTGYLAASKSLGQDRSQPFLFKTTNGGKTWDDMNLPLEVGKISGMGNMPLDLSIIAAMYFDAHGNGILVGSAFITKIQGGQGGEKAYYKNAAYLTRDGGATWWHTNVGTVKISFQNMPPTEGAMVTGCFQDLGLGWVAGSNGFVYAVRRTCQKAGDCPAGYECKDGLCSYDKNVTTDGQAGGDEGNAEITGRDAFVGGGSEGNITPDDNGGTDGKITIDENGVVADSDVTGKQGTSSGGCDTGGRSVPGVWMFFLVSLVAFIIGRRWVL